MVVDEITGMVTNEPIIVDCSVAVHEHFAGAVRV